MRKFVLIATMVMASATAQAGQSRSLTTALADQPVTSTQPSQTADAATPAAPAETPKSVERPAAVDTTTTRSPPKADPGKEAPRTAKVDKPRRRKHWTEARIIGELHRHGIYW